MRLEMRNENEKLVSPKTRRLFSLYLTELEISGSPWWRQSKKKNFNQKLINKRSFNFFYVRSLSFQSKFLLLFGAGQGCRLTWRCRKLHNLMTFSAASFLCLDEIKSILRVLFSWVPSQRTQFTSFCWNFIKLSFITF